ncbi:MAG: NAD(P)/FAD-dependent oxidoreductase, partial [candidate division WOR-3 bacterium]
MPRVHDVAIVGCGPAGISAALQLRRAGIDPLVFEARQVGGLLNNAYLVENYPGFPDGISGAGLVKKFQKHLKKWNIKVRMKKVDAINKQRNYYLLSAGRTYCCRFVVYAAGTRPRMHSVGLKAARKYIVYDVVSLGRVRGKHIVIIGAGDAAFDYALGLGERNLVTILNRTRKTKGLGLLFDRLHKGVYRKNVRYMENTRIISIKNSTADKEFNVIVRARSGNQTRDMHCHFVLAALGREPELEGLSKGLKRMHPESTRNFLFVGDVKNGDARQT